ASACRAPAPADGRPPPPLLDPAHEALAGPGETLALIVTLDAINFGSGWFPALRKRPGCSGYLTVAGALRERFAAEGPWSARELAAVTTEDCARPFGQQGHAGAGQLVA